jgi:hypothetical protein
MSCSHSAVLRADACVIRHIFVLQYTLYVYAAVHKVAHHLTAYPQLTVVFLPLLLQQHTHYNCRTMRGRRPKAAAAKRASNSSSSNRRTAPKRSPLTTSTAAPTASPEQLLELTVTVHTSCAEAFGASPLEFIGFLRAWHALHAGRRDALIKSSSDLRAGLGKLREAADTVDALSRRYALLLQCC